MRESLVRELYYGNLSPWERKRVYNPERTALNGKIDSIGEHFKNLLSPEEYEKFAEMKELESQVVNSIDFSRSMHYNPLAYIKNEADVLKFVNTLIANTKLNAAALRNQSRRFHERRLSHFGGGVGMGYSVLTIGLSDELLSGLKKLVAQYKLRFIVSP